ncbi:GH116 family glycosyl-hydrolase [Daejeonella sp.]|jgi:uncharacterized protein (DUF608 family)|uniref:GH116 family glycosyl-hydrolase n=1 Tax=Daejeonella sp. TaxID=2805397 RepID=UPI0037C0BB7B
MQRRFFLKTSGIFAAGMYANRARAIAGPFLPGELVHNIPVDKKLDPQWVKSLFQRGSVSKYYKSKNELNFIGMPVGGINTGTVYLGGDGRLWLWDIFNSQQEGIDPKSVDWGTELHVGKKVRSRDGSAYVQPARDIRPMEQGFAFKIQVGKQTYLKKMIADDWDEIIFEATYPMASIRYISKELPLEITANVYSPFIPLDEKSSGLPCTIYSFSIKNNSQMPVSVSILGWLENKVSIRSAGSKDIRRNEVLAEGKLKTVQGSINLNGSLLQLQDPDFGTLGIASLGGDSKAITDLQFPITLASFAQQNEKFTEKTIDQQLIAAVRAVYQIKPGATIEAHFSIAWHFANLKLNQAIQDKGRYYANWFSSASEVLTYVHQNFSSLSNTSKLWKNTWFDSSLPWWFLERTFSNISTLATTTAHRFRSGRFYAWEGVGCCEGTCTHVWQYAQAVGRIFPGIERDTRQRIDLGLSLQPDGMIWYRGEVVKTAAIDGQAGTILRIYREHQMSVDKKFLNKNWDKIKLATEWVIRQDKNQDGMEDTPIENTLDAVWDGEIAWLVVLCIAAVKAAGAMAAEMKDSEFEKICNEYVIKGSRNMEEKLFNGEYFIHRPDEIKGREKLGSYNTCHIDQVYGQSWSHQVALGRIIDKEKTLKALQSLWKYNFTPDVGPYIKERTGGRPYALAGEGGLVMNTNPKNETRPYGDNITWQLGYFHECMSGFEHQVASHMMAEGMTDEAMVITRMIHDRYHAAKRNPFNEIECSDHYARAMASYGTFITACGFEYHGPNGHMAFNPKLNPEKFKAPFTSAAAWGCYEQERGSQKLQASLLVQYGELSLNSFSLHALHQVTDLQVMLDDQLIPASILQEGNRCTLKFSSTIRLVPGQKLSFKV